jgi:hypothetical protein
VNQENSHQPSNTDSGVLHSDSGSVEKSPKILGEKNHGASGVGSSLHYLDSLGRLLDRVVEGASLLVHGTEGIVAHTLNSIPENPVKVIAFIVVLLVFVLVVGVKARDAHDLCFGCMIGLTIIGVGVIAIVLRNPGNNQRLADMQEQRVVAVGVKPIPYGTRKAKSAAQNTRD